MLEKEGVKMTIYIIIAIIVSFGILKKINHIGHLTFINIIPHYCTNGQGDIFAGRIHRKLTFCMLT